MRRCRLFACLLGVLLGACGGPPVIADARGPFDTSVGVAGGNEFGALSPEGRRTLRGDAAAQPASPAPAAPVALPVAPPPAAAPAPVVTLAQAGPAAAAPAAADAPIAIDANAYGAVFGGATGPVRPTAAQLMQLDSLSLIAAETLRIDLQTKILACRRAGDACRLAAR